MEQLHDAFTAMVEPENLWRAWVLFRRGKRHRPDVRAFERHLERNLLVLRDALVRGAYRHGPYRSFIVYDPKRRTIHVPMVHDQVVHQMVWNVAFPFFDRRFSPAVMSCRPDRGTHAAVARIRRIAKRIGRRSPVHMLHLDIRKFFDSVPHELLRAQLEQWIADERMLGVLDEIIGSYDSGSRFPGDPPGTHRGIPLGNLTSQLFANIVLMPFDRFVCDVGWGRAYVRYADDAFVVATDDAALRALGTQFSAALETMGFACRRRVCRFHGFEALGARVFSVGCGIRRNTRRRTLAKMRARARAYATGTRSVAALGATAASLRGLVGASRDVRWSRAMSQVILAYA